LLARALHQTTADTLTRRQPPGVPQMLAPAPIILAPVPTVQPAALIPSATSRDVFFALLGNAPSTAGFSAGSVRPATSIRFMLAF
jgi:hypothetical protein